MSLRGRINQNVTDWRNQAGAAMKTPTDHGPQIESILQHAIDRHRSDGVDLSTLFILFIFLIGLVGSLGLLAGFIFGKL